MRIENGSVQNNNDKMSYNEYKNKLAVNKRQNIMMFTSIFLVLLLVFLGVARIMSPDIDITLGEDTNRQETPEDEYSHGIDSRLKALQQEDEMKETNNPENAIEEDGLVKIPKHEDKSISETNEEEPVVTQHTEKELLKKEEHEDINPQAPTAPTAPTTPVAKTYRVIVGSYSTREQAEVARGILQEAGLGVSPNIKSVGGTFTLQAGAFSSQDSANNLSNKLLMHNYPARVVSE